MASKYEDNKKIDFKERGKDKIKSKKEKKDEDKVSLLFPIISIFVFVFGVILLTADFQSAGKLGQAIFNFFINIFGWPTYFSFALFFALAYYLWREIVPDVKTTDYISAPLLLLFITSFTSSIGIPASGLLGGTFANILEKNFGSILSVVISFFLSAISVMVMAGEKPSLRFLKFIYEKILELFGKAKDASIKNPLSPTINEVQKSSKNIFKKIWNFILNFIYEDAGSDSKMIKIKNHNGEEEYVTEDDLNENKKRSGLHGELLKNFKNTEQENFEDESAEALDNFKNKNNTQTVSQDNAENLEMKKAKAKSEKERLESVKVESKPIVIEENFVAPALSLLSADSGKSSAGDSKFKMNAIQKTLDQFGIPVEMGEVTVGPSVTQFTLKPAQGVNVKKILSLKDNLQMALSATNMHIEAPIPGKPFVGIEIPNEKKSTLGLRSLLEISEFQDGPSLSLAVGKNIVGKPVISDLAKMPHLLVAGATGTGKSVTLHNLILSMLYKNSPHDLKLIILDPKRVEFTAYNALPHLYTPIIKDPKTAIKSLNWAAQEMDRRYDVLGEYGVANIGDYNKKILFPALEKAKKKFADGSIVEGLPPKMPFIVIVFDEYNDFMLSYPKEITPIITSLTQKARAAGIHLILATQRPDVKVITGTIKANIPARIALKTTSQIDSRTILDQAGAEDLLGNGDMLYMNGSNIVRVQAPFVSTEEIHEVIKDIKKKYDDFMPDEINLDKVKVSQSAGLGFREMEESENESRDPREEPTDDEDYMSARDYVISTGKASTSALQTAFRWGYNKAARIINDLENYGIISAPINGRNREVLFGKDTHVESEVERLERELSEMENKNREDEGGDDTDDENEYLTRENK